MEHIYEQIFQALMLYQKHLQSNYGINLQLDVFKIVAQYAAFVPLKCGWLDQRGKKHRWGKRWVALVPGELVVFKDESYKKLRGRIPIDSCLVEIAPESKYHRKFCFELTSPLLNNRTFVFVSANATHLQEWMTSIRRAMLKLRRDRTKTVDRTNDKESRRSSVTPFHDPLTSSPKTTPLSTSTEEKFGVYLQWLDEAKNERRNSYSVNHPPPQTMDEQEYRSLEDQNHNPDESRPNNQNQNGCTTCLHNCAASMNSCAASMKRKCVIL